jgi:hypothetical protein
MHDVAPTLRHDILKGILRRFFRRAAVASTLERWHPHCAGCQASRQEPEGQRLRPLACRLEGICYHVDKSPEGFCQEIDDYVDAV